MLNETNYSFPVAAINALWVDCLNTCNNNDNDNDNDNNNNNNNSGTWGFPHREKRKRKVGKVPGFKKGSSLVMACKCYCNERSGSGLRYGDKELTTESSAKTSVCKNGISTESGIPWNHKKLAKSSSSLRLQVVACPQRNNDRWTSKLRNFNYNNNHNDNSSNNNNNNINK